MLIHWSCGWDYIGSHISLAVSYACLFQVRFQDVFFLVSLSWTLMLQSEVDVST